jgi:putative membrane protein
VQPDRTLGTEAVDVRRLERPHRNLLVYYGLGSLLLGPFFFVALVPLYFRYHTLRYQFDEEGVSMRWGILFRREIHLTYARIQDIHLTSNVVERWLGMGRVQVQTASGSAKAEMTIEGLQEFEAVRDYLYARMRGMREERHGGVRGAVGPAGAGPASPAAAGLDAAAVEELATTLLTVARELREVSRTLAARSSGGAAGGVEPPGSGG